MKIPNNDGPNKDRMEHLKFVFSKNLSFVFAFEIIRIALEAYLETYQRFMMEFTAVSYFQKRFHLGCLIGS